MTEEEIRQVLIGMVDNPSLVTKPSFRASDTTWSGGNMPFIEDHLDYLKRHPKIDPITYLSNLRIMLRKN